MLVHQPSIAHRQFLLRCILNIDQGCENGRDKSELDCYEDKVLACSELDHHHNHLFNPSNLTLRFQVDGLF